VNIGKILRSEYRSRFPEGDRLGRVAGLVNWDAFRSVLEPLFKNSGEGRPHVDVVLMVKVLILQSWYGLADEQVERDCKDRLTFMNFLGYPSKVPDVRTIWFFRERLAEDGGKKEKEIWIELQRQLDRYRVKVKQGQMKDAIFIELGGWRKEGHEGPVVAIAPHTGYAQDSTIIDADSGAPTEENLKMLKEKQKTKQQESSAASQPISQDAAAGKESDAIAAAATVTVRAKPRGDKAKTTRSKDGTWTKKRGRSYFGFKLHTKDELSTGLISDFEVTTASVHDNNIDLTKLDEPCVRDRGYTGGRGLCVNMIRATRGTPLTQEDKELNRFLSTVRAPVEHPFAVIKRVFHSGRVLVTTVVRVKTKMIFVCTCYNLFRALTLSQRMK